VEKQRGALRLAACNMPARVQGLRVGQALAEARAIVPLLQVSEINHNANKAALLRLAAVCERFTPLVALDGTDGLLLDVTGCAHLHGGEAGLQKALAEVLARRGFTLHQAMASSFACAHVVARFGRVVNVAPGAELEAVARFPVAALECEAASITALTRAGLRTIGDLAARPSSVLTARFGSKLVSQLNRVLAREDARLSPLRPEAELLADALFAEPIRQMDHVMAALSRLVEQLCAEMEKCGLGGRAFEARFFRADGEVRHLSISTSAPMREAASLSRLFALRIDTLSDPLEAGFGFDGLRLAVLRSEALGQSQASLDDRKETSQSTADLINRLAIRFSATRVLGFVARDSHDPLRAAAAVPIGRALCDVAWRSGDDPLPRPLHLFVPPQPIEVMAEVPDGPPIRFRWRKVLHRVRAAEGPERIEGEWWRETGRAVRDYYRVEDDDGARFWIFREGLFTAPAPRWFLHGLFA
jgi:protein ImuB